MNLHDPRSRPQHGGSVWPRRRRRAALALATLLAAPAWSGSPVLHGAVNLNQATMEQLVLLPGVGEHRARAILELRRKRGGFKKVEELAEVKGIGEAALQRLAPFVKLQGSSNLRVD